MAEPFIGEIRFFSYAWPPRDWALCDGSLLPVNENQALFSLLGITFGGNGTQNFALPDLRGRVPMHIDSNTLYGRQGVKGGVNAVTLSLSQIPTHTHLVAASDELATVDSFDNAKFASASGNSGSADVYAEAGPQQVLNSGSVSTTGDSQAHPNCQPSLVGNYCIALRGIFPSRD